ncbi:ferritin [Patescibacteria group bacterium]|nr:ferritin [Patescibacteria group bacterium]
MQTYICQICGDAYVGEGKPTECPFCGAPDNFIKPAKEARPIVNEKIEIGEISRKNLEATYDLEVKASAIYACMAGKAKTYEVKAMFKRLAKIELEHAVIANKLLGNPVPVVSPESCSDEDTENFQATVALEKHATEVYAKFLQEATETNIRILFNALNQIEADHIKLMENYLA